MHLYSDSFLTFIIIATLLIIFLCIIIPHSVDLFNLSCLVHVNGILVLVKKYVNLNSVILSGKNPAVPRIWQEVRIFYVVTYKIYSYNIDSCTIALSSC
jgi:hypothetical protein